MGIRLLFGIMKMFSKTVMVMVANTVNILKTAQLYLFKERILQYVIYIAIF